jgi:DNA-binding response OmpR family regulator
MSGTTPDPTKLVFGSVELRLAERRLMVEGQSVALGSRGFDLLKALVLARERVVTKDELLDEVWPGLVVEENNLQVQISGLRRVLGAGAISTVAGVGYRFTLTEGAAADPPAAAPPPLATPAITAARVLVADDNKVNRLLLCRTIQLMGHQVSSADNGRQTLAMLRQQRFELLLLDLAMPELDGFGVLQARAQDAALREVAVIVTSALGGVAPVARCIELGADDFLHKPVDPWLLKARVESSLMRKQQRDLQGDTLRRLMPGGTDLARRLPDATVLVTQLHPLDAMEQTPQDTVGLLDNWCTLMFDAVQGRGGEVAQFCGNNLLALFSEPQAAVHAARDMVDLMRLFNQDRQAAGGAALGASTGLARGAIVVGLVATAHRAACACIGAPVLRAQRLAAACTAGDHVLAMDEATHAGLAADMPSMRVCHATEGWAYFVR